MPVQRKRFRGGDLGCLPKPRLSSSANVLLTPYLAGTAHLSVVFVGPLFPATFRGQRALRSRQYVQEGTRTPGRIGGAQSTWSDGHLQVPQPLPIDDKSWQQKWCHIVAYVSPTEKRSL